MGGRFGKYGDIKRRRSLQRSRCAKTRLAAEDAADRRKKKRPDRSRSS